MKSTLLLFLFPLFSIGVFCTDVKEPVSVMVGDSVTLHINTKIHAADVTVWSFGQKTIAMIDEGSSIITTSDENLKDRLQLVKQTGDLKIRNIKTTDSGDYKLDITRASRTEESVTMTFGVSVVSADEVKPLSVLVRDSVTLQTGLTEIQTNDVIQWRFGQQKSLVAEINRAAGIFNTYDGPDGRFRDRLQLDQTGSLIINNMRTSHSGLYEVDIISTSSRYTRHHTQSFTVTVRGAEKPVSVKERGSVTLQTVTELQKDDQIWWMFEDTVLAEIYKADQRFYTSDGPFKSFRNRLKLDNQTGSLIITDTRTTDSGVYELKIRSSRDIINRRFSVTVTGAEKPVSVKERGSVTLQTVTELQKDDQIWWMFEDTVLAEIYKADQRFSTYNGPDERFRNRLKLDNQTGSLIITDTRTTDSGVYELKIRSSRDIINRRFSVTVTEPALYPTTIALIVVAVVLLVAAAAAVVIYRRNKISQPKWSWKTLSVMEGETVPLHPSGTEIIKEDNIRWLFKKSPLAEIRRKHPAPFNVLHENFKGRLDWPGNLGPLIITNLQITDSGLYELQIIRSENNIQTLELFSVTVYAKTEKKIKEVKEGGSVTLESGVTGIQKDDEILWKFALKDAPIAAIQGGKKKTPPFGAGWRYRFRLNLDENGSLTIKHVRPLDTGFYTLHITRSGNTSLHLFRVKISTSEYVDLDELRKNQTQLSVLYEQLKVIHMQKEASKTQQCESAGRGPKNSSIPMAVEELYEQLVKLFKNQSQPPVLYEQLSESAGSGPESNPFLKTAGEYVNMDELSETQQCESAGSDPENSPFLKKEADDHVPLHHLHEYGGALRITTVK